MKRILLLLSALTVSVLSYSQRGSISGTVIDSLSGDHIPYASLVLLENGSPTNNGAVSDEQGNFELLHIEFGSYDLLVSFIGYRKDTIRGIEISRDQTDIRIGDFRLTPSGISLEGAEVSTMAQTVSTSIDRRTYRAADFQTAQGGNAVDLLNKLPSVTVSPDGIVSVRGTPDFLVYLNGQPTRMDPSVLLAQLSSDQIEKVEVISIPSAKYDAQGKGGIINISTSSRGPEGLTINANAQGGGAPWGHLEDRYSGYKQNDYRYGGNLGILYSRDRMNLFGNLNYSMKNVNGRRVGDARILDPATGAFKHMVAGGERPEWYENFSMNAGLEYQVSETSSLDASYFFGRRKEGRSAFYVYQLFYGDENKEAIDGVDRNERWIYNPNTDNRYGDFHTATLNFRNRLGESGLLTLSALYENSGLSRELDNYDYNYDPVSDAAGDIQEYYNQTDNTPLIGYRFAAEFAHSFTENQTLEIGIQPQFFSIAGSFSYDTLGIAENSVNDYTTLENSIDLQRDVYAGYINFNSSGSKFSYNAGLRLEYTDQLMDIENPDYFNIFDRAAESTYEVNKLDWFPTLQLSYDLGEDRFLFAASRRITRPPIKNMAPFLYRRHLEVYVVGDPALKPEYATTAELTYDRKLGKSTMTLTGFYRGVDNAVFRVNTVYYDELVLIRSYTNSGETRALGAEMNANIVLAKNAKLFLGGSLYQFRVQGDVFGYQENNSSANWSLKGALNVNFTSQLKWTSDFDMQSATVTAQGRNEMFYFLNSALSYSPAGLKNWSFNLKGLDLLSSNIKGLDTRAFDASGEQIFFQETTYFRYGPIVELGISYAFNTNGKSMRTSKSEFGSKEF